MEKHLIEIYVENDNSIHTFTEGTTLYQILKGINIERKEQYIAAFVDNIAKMLSDRILSSCHVRFIDRHSSSGLRIYIQSVQLILEKAIVDITGSRNFRVVHSVRNGIFVEIEDLSQELVEKIKKRMDEIIESDIPFLVKDVEYGKALKMFEELGCNDRVKFLETKPQFYVSLNEIDGYIGHLFGTATVPSTGFIDTYDIYMAGGGLVLMPDKQYEMSRMTGFLDKPKFYHIASEYKRWSKYLGIANAGDINHHIMEGKGKYLVMIGEALHEKRIAMSADRIVQSGSRTVLISGPSSSGKTTFTKRLSIQLAINGLLPVPISMDDYFVERDKTPKDADGNYDFECLEAVDTDLFNSDVRRLLDGETIDTPKYDFINGKRIYDGTRLKLKENSILLIEGIHALNPAVLSEMDRKNKYLIFASAITPLSIDSGNIIHASDNRIIRRIIRDYRTRGRSAHDTLKYWESVRNGEEKYIFPYEENADEIINTALVYELSVLAPKVAELLRQVPVTAAEYAEAARLLNFLNCFAEINEDTVPPTSLLREFIGGSAFNY